MKTAFNKILIIGAGTMGQQIAAHIAKHNIDVVLYDISVKNLESARVNMKIDLNTDNFETIKFTSDLTEAVVNVDLVIEAIIENLKLKKLLFKQLNTLCKKKTIFTSNTSDLLPSKIAKSTGRKELFCAYHFHAPRYGADIVDIMPHKDTAIETISRLETFTKDINLIPIIIKKEHPAYIYNAILNSIMNTSLTLVIKGVANYQEIDKAWMGNTGMKIGPFGMLDLIGLDTALEITKNRAKKNPLRLFGVAYFNKFIKQGKLGVKTGEGFYKYPGPEYTKNNFLK
jgi:3-hydroxybutyryl-CoA dehydrogenase